MQSGRTHSLRAGAVRLDDQWWHNASSWAGIDHTLDDSYAVSMSRMHHESIKASRIFWLLAPELPSRGADSEFGYALALKERWPATQQIVVSGARGRASIFYRSAGVINRSTDDEAIEDVLRLAREWIRDFEARASVA